MTAADFHVTSVTPDQHGAIQALLRAAFGGPDEAELVDRLRRDGDVVLELAARTGAEPGAPITGHILFSRLHIGDAYAPGIALAPLAVAPAEQGRGVGGALVRAGLARLREMGESIVFVLGEPVYYGRFGFEAALAARYEAPWPGPAFQALALGPPPPPGALRYPAAFGAAPAGEDPISA